MVTSGQEDCRPALASACAYQGHSWTMSYHFVSEFRGEIIFTCNVLESGKNSCSGAVLKALNYLQSYLHHDSTGQSLGGVICHCCVGLPSVLRGQISY